MVHCPAIGSKATIVRCPIISTTISRAAIGAATKHISGKVDTVKPLIARWPGVIAPNTETDALTCLTDLMATCAAIVGTEVPEDAGQDSCKHLTRAVG